MTSDDDMRCVVRPRVPGVASVISLQLSPAELIGAETVKARHNVIMSPVSHRVAVTPGPGHNWTQQTSSENKIVPSWFVGESQPTSRGGLSGALSVFEHYCFPNDTYVKQKNRIERVQSR